jgi:hypothetical protein
MTGNLRRCESCRAVLARTSRPDRRFCTAACRQTAYEKRRAPSWDERAADAAGRVEEAEDGRLLDRARRQIRTSAVGRRRLRGGVRQYPMRRSSQTSALRSATCSLSAISACAVGLVITEPSGCR